MQVLDIEWCITQPRAHKYIMDLAESGLPPQIKLKMVWLVDRPSQQLYNQINGLSMVPFRVTPGFTSLRQSSLEQMSKVIRQHIEDKLDHYTQLEESGCIFKEMNIMEILTKPENELVSPFAGKIIALGNKYLKLPKTLDTKHCLINIQNRDNACFQYAMVCWKLGYYKPRDEGGLEHPERWPRHYIEGGAKRGRPAANTDQTFKTAGMDFSMFCFDNHPPTHEELLEFEAKADVSVFV